MKREYLIHFLLLFFVMNSSLGQEKTTIVVAANLKSAMDSVVKSYRYLNPKDDFQIIYGASGKFYEQISNGAPFDLFFSADVNFPKQLKIKGYAVSLVKKYAVGRLVLWSKKYDPNLLKINALLDSKIKKIAIANPQTAPYGAKAVACLKYYKIYDKVKSNLVYGENIGQTAQFVSLGAADVGFIALSDALSPIMKNEKGKFYIIPQESYPLLEQACVILKHGKNNIVAKKLFDFISTNQAIKILNYYGYSQSKK